MTSSYEETVKALGGNLAGGYDVAVQPGVNSLDDRPEVTICGICKEPLNRYENDYEQVWLHGRTYRDYGHDPVPTVVPRTERRNQLCDFCGQPSEIYWTLHGEAIRQTTGKVKNDYGTVWSACEPCSTFLLVDDIDGLADRVVRLNHGFISAAKEALPFMRAEIIAMWNQFLRTVTDRKYVGPRKEPARLDPRMMPKIQRGVVKFWQHENLPHILRQNRGAAGQTAIPGVHCGDEDAFARTFPSGVNIPNRVVENHIQHLVAGIWASELYWISSNFTQLAIMAGKDLDKIVVSREELPSSFGLMVFEQPIGEIQRRFGVANVRAVSWTLVPQGIWINLYVQGEDSDPLVDVEQMRRNMGYLLCPNPGSGIQFDEEIPLPEPGDYDFILTILATWFLMNQPGVAEQTSAPVDKKIARAYQREHNRRLPDVKLVDLRRRPRRPGTEPETREGHKLTVRVYRRGHWKRQAYGPKHGMRKTIYVSAYIAGPEDAPLKQRPATVKVLR